MKTQQTADKLAARVANIKQPYKLSIRQLYGFVKELDEKAKKERVKCGPGSMIRVTFTDGSVFEIKSGYIDMRQMFTAHGHLDHEADVILLVATTRNEAMTFLLEQFGNRFELSHLSSQTSPRWALNGANKSGSPFGLWGEPKFYTLQSHRKGLVAEDMAEAMNMALDQVSNDWGDNWQISDLRVLGVAEGRVEIVFWEDLDG